MSLTKEDFTSSELIDNFERGDNTIEIVGYAVVKENNLGTSSNSKFEKYVISNADGKKVQITAWNNLMPKISSLVLGNIVHINSLKYNLPAKEYNSGNVAFELLVTKNTEVVDYGEYPDAYIELAPEEVSLLEAYGKIGSKIRIDGIIKTEPAVYVNKGYKGNVASLTNTNDELELKINFDLSFLKEKLIKGFSFEITGVMEQYSPGPPVLRVDNPEDIVKLDRPRVGFLEVLKGFRTRELE